MEHIIEKGTETPKKTLKMHVVGTFQRWWTVHVLQRKAKALGVSVEGVRHHSPNHTEITFSGEPKKLWKVIGHSQAPSFLLKLDKITFQFLD